MTPRHAVDPSIATTLADAPLAATPADETASNAAWRALRDAAALPYRAAGRYAWHFARGKLGGDPLYRHLLASGAILPQSDVLDVGCGLALVAALLRAVDLQAARQAAWPDAWAPPPVGTSVVGIERMPRDVDRARAAFGDGTRIVHGDMRSTALPACDTALLFDVLHYIAPADQDALLDRVHRTLRPHGRLLLRVADASQRGPWRLTTTVDRLVARARGLPFDGLHARSLAAWQDHLRSLGFAVRIAPMNGRLPLANMLLVCDKAAG